MKDWLIIMVVVIVGLMFLTHSTGVPGQKGPNGGASLFGAASPMIGMLMQWGTFIFTNIGVLLFAAFVYSDTFWRNFPVPFGILGGDPPKGSLYWFKENGYFNFAEGAKKLLHGNAADLIEQQATYDNMDIQRKAYIKEAVAAFPDTMNQQYAKQALSLTDELSTKYPELAEATNATDFANELEYIMIRDTPSVPMDKLQRVIDWMRSDKLPQEFLRGWQAQKCMANAKIVSEMQVYAADFTQALAKKSPNSSQVVRMMEVILEQPTLAKTLYMAQKVKEQEEVPQKMKAANTKIKKSQFKVFNVSDMKTSINDAVKEKLSKEAFGGKALTTEVSTLLEMIGKMKTSDFQTRGSLLEALKNKAKAQKQVITDSLNTAEQGTDLQVRLNKLKNVPDPGEIDHAAELRGAVENALKREE